MAETIQFHSHVGDDGVPHVVPLWFVWHDGAIWLNSLRKTRRHRHLLTGRPVDGGARGSHYLLAFQRFGAGKSVVLPIQDSWMWQMHALIAVEDQTHETFWRQMMRWLVSGVPGTVTLATSGCVAERVASTWRMDLPATD